VLSVDALRTPGMPYGAVLANNNVPITNAAAHARMIFDFMAKPP